MEFFLPNATDDTHAEEVYEAIRKHAAEVTTQAVLDRRIHRIHFRHDGYKHTATVGEIEPRENEKVYAILEASTVYLICTPNRGVARGLPLIVGKHDTDGVEDFD